MRALVTGNQGYIGCHLVDVLKRRGHEVAGCDLGLFAGCEWDELPAADLEVTGDIRDLREDHLRGYDVVMHLAAISNDPMGDVDETLTHRVNAEASVQLAQKARAAGVPRFLFASSCSIYGQGEMLDLDESAAFNPISAYAQSKIDAEAGILGLATDDFSPVSLRNATAYGDSSALRIDLVANNLLASAVAYQEVRIMSDGTPWRPLIHCRDIANAFVAFAEVPRERVHGRAVNVGANDENYQVREVAAIVQDLVPEAEIVFTGEVGRDPRDYRVNFALLGELLPDFGLEYGLRRGMEELFEHYRAAGFDAADFEGEQFVRLRTLRKRLSLLDGNAAEAGA
jgi:nucleoside-diphosphate-sugar epimerase